MPYSRRLHEELKDENISFVYVCMESEEAQFKSIIERYQLAGSHYFLDANQSASFAPIIQSCGFPQYLIIDSEGNILEYYAKDPSHKDIGDILRNLTEP